MRKQIEIQRKIQTKTHVGTQRKTQLQKQKHTTPLLSAVALSMTCGTLFASFSAHGIYQKYNTDGWSQPVISVLIQGLSHQDDSSGLPVALLGLSTSAPSDGTMTETAGSADSDVSIAGTSGDTDLGEAAGGQQAAGSGTSAGLQDASVQDASAGLQNSSVPGAPAGLQNDSVQDASTGQQNTSAPGTPTGQPPLEQPEVSSDTPPEASQSTSQDNAESYEFSNVTQDYFDDALFIGDSRVTGVQLYSGWDNLTYYCEGGLTIYNMFQSKTAKVDGKTLTIEEALQQCTFGKIYLEIGINEMGTGTVDSFMEAYGEAVQHLRELQPDAIIYVCGIMYVKQSKSESDPIFNNPNIQERNDRIAGLANGEDIFYLDINELVTDETGNLNPDYTWDEVHLLGKYDALWLDYFSSHGIVKDAG